MSIQDVLKLLPIDLGKYQSQIKTDKLVTLLGASFNLACVGGDGKGSLQIRFQDGFRLTIAADDQNQTILIINDQITVQYSYRGLVLDCDVSGVAVDIPGPINPSIKKIHATETEITVSGAFFSKTFPVSV